MPRYIQPSFSRGEVSPAVYGRVDARMYSTALRTARNTIIHVTGGISNRPGTTFIGPVKNHTTKTRLVEFQFKTTDTHILEFGNLYIRILRNDAHVTEDAKTITGATKANPVVITATAHGYTNGDEVLIESVVGMTQINGKRFLVANKEDNTFELTDQVTSDNINGTSYTTYTSGGTSSKIFTLTTPYLEADLFTLKFAQSADVLTIVHPTYAIRELNRISLNNWTLTQPTFAPTITFPLGQAVAVNSAGSETERYRVTALDSETFEESLPALNNTTKTISGATAANPVVITATAHGFLDGDEVHITGIVGMTELNDRRFTVANKNTNDFELKGENGTSHTAWSSAGTAAQTFVRITNGHATPDNTITWSEVADAVKYSVYKETNGIFGWIGDTELLTFDDENIAPDASIGPPRSRNPFLVTGEYPGAVGYFQQRRVFGGSNNKPDTSYYSQIGSFSNFTVSSPTQSDDAITATLTAGQVNQIRHYLALNDLLLFTEGSEWLVNAKGDSSFTPSTIDQSRQSRWGVSQLPPIVSGSTVIFTEEVDNSIRSFGYSFQLDAYTGSHLSLLSSHLFAGHTLVDWAYQQQPDSVIYAVRDDGIILTMTFDQEQEVVAWCHWDTLGKYKSVAVIRPSITSSEQALYMVVERIINGNTVQYIERTHTRIFNNVRDAFFVDSGLSLDSPVTITGSTKANPVVITATAHGFSNGDEVDIFDVLWTSDFDSVDNETQPDQLNGKRFTVANKTANTFELTGIDGSGYNTYISGGTVRVAVSTISGLDHLEGENIAILADGGSVSGKTIASGGFTLANKASRIHAGLKYITDIETLDVETPSDSGTIQGRMKKISKVTIRFERTRGLFLGHDTSDLKEMKQREFEAMSDPTALLTGDKPHILSSRWDTNGRLFFRQSFPLPLTILAIIPDIEIEE